VVDDDLNGGEFVGPSPFVVSEDEHNGAILDEITRVAVGGAVFASHWMCNVTSSTLCSIGNLRSICARSLH